jgi:hypothetical protein
MNMAGNLGSALVALAFSCLSQGGAPAAPLHIGAALTVAGALAWLFAGAAHKIHEQLQSV